MSSDDRTLTRRAFAAGVVTIAGCGRVIEEAAAPVDAGPTDAGVVVPTFAPPCSFPPFTLPGIRDEAPAHRTLYTWTTRRQVEELATTRAIYTKTADDDGNRGWLFDFLAGLAEKGDATAQVLVGDDFHRGRYAWPLGWATLLTREQFGLELVRIDLRDDARFVTIGTQADTQTARFGAVDIQNGQVPLAEALAEPTRVAGLFFNNGIGDGYCQSSINFAAGYREFHLCHESTVVEWSVGTSENLAAIDEWLALLDSMQGAMQGDCRQIKAPSCEEMPAIWRSTPTNDRERFIACLAFAWPLANVSTLEEFLSFGRKRLEQARFTPSPLRHRPNG